MLAGRKKMEAADVRSYMRAFVDQPGRIDVRTVARALVGLTALTTSAYAVCVNARVCGPTRGDLRVKAERPWRLLPWTLLPPPSSRHVNCSGSLAKFAP